jgi:protein subunit release factor A
MNERDLDIGICKGEYSHVGSVETGVKITHRATGITVSSLKEKSQYANKVIAMELLEIELAKHCKGSASGILKDTPTNKQFSDDESLQSALDNEEKKLVALVKSRLDQLEIVVDIDDL